MKIIAVIIIPFLVVFVAPAFCSAQGTLAISFDGPPAQPTNTQFGITSYTEAGMLFEPGPDDFDGQFERNTGGSALYPNDKTAYLQAGFGESLEFNFSNGSLFGLSTVNLAAYGVNQPDYTVDFIGYRSDGSTINTSFSGTGIQFQTYNFSSDWSSGLTEVVIPNAPWSLDNLAVIVPEPGSTEMFALGAVEVSLWRSRRK